MVSEFAVVMSRCAAAMAMTSEARSKQKRLHGSLAVRARQLFYRVLCCFGIATFVAMGAASLQAQTLDDGSANRLATLRLVAAAGPENGRYEAGVDMALTPGSHTYWKMPGESGVPPVFAFNGSENVKAATVMFPVPSRITEEGIDAFGYAGRVVFPVVVTPLDPAKPATLHVDLNYAVCNRICLPGHYDATLSLRPRGPGVAGNLVQAALREVPQPVAAAPQALRAARVGDAAQPSWMLSWQGAGAPDDIFADAPEGFYFSTKKTGAGIWMLTAAQSVTAPTATEVPVTLVLATPGGGAVQFTRPFDVGPGDR